MILRMGIQDFHVDEVMPLTIEKEDGRIIIKDKNGKDIFNCVDYYGGSGREVTLTLRY